MVRFIVAVTVFASVWVGIHSVQQREKERVNFMQLKLKAAQDALNGIATGHFPLIETSASDLAQLSKKAEFQLMKSGEYARHSDEFRRNAEEMAKAARAQNLDSATLAYVQMTFNCVNCHKHVRDPR
jgi:hypothetical protein